MEDAMKIKKHDSKGFRALNFFHVLALIVLVCLAIGFIAVIVMSYLGGRPGVVSDVQVNYGNSEIYTREDMDAAAETIKQKFHSGSEWRGYTLHTLSYASDENCGSDTLQELNDEFSTAYDQVIVFNSSFHTPKVSDGFSAADVEDSGFYWYLGRKNGGSWEVINAGY